jgi:CRISPR-associated protein Cmr4
MSYQATVFLIKTITNLHAGSGDSEYGVVDKLVQRDSVSTYPTIHSSSLKGALREHLEVVENTASTEITTIFGSETSAPNPVHGTLRFLAADCLSLPKPDESIGNSRAFERIYSGSILNEYIAKAQSLGTTLDKQALITAIGSNSRQDDTAFKALAAKGALPVLARNQLDNGVSRNLWYEEFVPRESLFACIVLCPTDKAAVMASFMAKTNNKVIQFGGNATVGYGLCSFTAIITAPQP